MRQQSMDNIILYESDLSPVSVCVHTHYGKMNAELFPVFLATFVM